LLVCHCAWCHLTAYIFGLILHLLGQTEKVEEFNSLFEFTYRQYRLLETSKVVFDLAP
jgi:hypothetical protein